MSCSEWRVIVPEQPLCCGLTWISTGQLATAQRVLRRTVDALAPYLRRGVKVVGLEPSCTAVSRSDASELMPGDHDVQRLRDQTVTLAELLRHHTDGWQPPRIASQAIAQTHCHQHAIMGYDEDKALLAAAGLDVDVLDAGCCGLAGNFGFQAGTGRTPAHLAEVLAAGLRGQSVRPSRPAPPSPADYARLAAIGASAAVGAGLAAARRRKR